MGESGGKYFRIDHNYCAMAESGRVGEDCNSVVVRYDHKSNLHILCSGASCKETHTTYGGNHFHRLSGLSSEAPNSKPDGRW